MILSQLIETLAQELTIVMIFRRGVDEPEGPVYLSDGSWVITEMGQGLISHISADGTAKRVVARTGRPNGLALDADENLWVAESRMTAVLKVTMGGEATLVSSGSPNRPFLWPNDLCFGPDGALYMTDSGILISDWKPIELTDAAYTTIVDGRLYRIDPQSGECCVLDRGLRFANGIAFGLGGDYLYVSETLTGNICRYHIVNGLNKGQRELFGNVMTKPCRDYGRVAGPDGMAFDIEGNLYVCVLVQGDVTVLQSTGAVKKRLSLEGTFPTNVAFAGPSERRILVTETSKNQLEMIETPLAGLPLYS